MRLLERVLPRAHPDDLHPGGRAPQAARRSPPARAGPDEPGPQRPRRDAERRAAVDGDARSPATTARAPLGQAGSLRPAHGHRHRLRDAARGGRAGVRAVLHHQAAGRGDRAGAGGRLGRHPAARRRHPLPLEGRRRDDVRDLPARSSSNRLGRHPSSPPPRPAAPSESWSPTISRYLLACRARPEGRRLQRRSPSQRRRGRRGRRQGGVRPPRPRRRHAGARRP